MKWPKPLRPIVARPHLIAGVILGAAIYIGDRPMLERSITRGLVAWDAGIALFIVLSLIWMNEDNYEKMRARALAHDEGSHIMLGLAMGSVVASVVAIMAELSRAKGAGQLQETFGVGLTAATIALSWFFLQLVFALHYAHMFYRTCEDTGTHKGGLAFPNDDCPDYWDFLHFSVVIGATSQTADISLTSKAFRRAATVHGLIAFAFNTAILATMINLAAGLF